MNNTTEMSIADSEALCVAAEILTETRRGYHRDLILSNIDFNDRALFECAYAFERIVGDSAVKKTVREGLRISRLILGGILTGQEPEETMELLEQGRSGAEMRTKLTRLNGALWREYKAKVKW
jgi:hypothetical protein